MDQVFPFAYPLPTQFYLVCYLFTLVIHVVFMNYVLAGTGYLALASLLGNRHAPSPMTLALRDWMPFFLSAAITAGIAPLLFLQILYQKNYYSANLLLFHRWMSILPVLIVASYLLYVLKSKTISHLPGWISVFVSFFAFACFAFTGYSWTENHLLSLHPEQWVNFYQGKSLLYHDAQLLPRILVWTVGSVPTMMLILCWQLYGQQHDDTKQIEPQQVQGAALIALLGLVSAMLIWRFWFLIAAHIGAELLGSRQAAPYYIAAILGGVLQGMGWLWIIISGRLRCFTLLLNSLGCLATIVGMSVIREVIRIDRIDILSLQYQHEMATRVGGFSIFIAFFIINLIVIIYCFRLVARARSNPPRPLVPQTIAPNEDI